MAGDDIGRIGCRLNEEVCGAMPRPPEEDERVVNVVEHEQGGGEAQVEVAQPRKVNTTIAASSPLHAFGAPAIGEAGSKVVVEAVGIGKQEARGDASASSGERW